MLGLENRAREREMVSRLLAHLHPAILSVDQAEAGFTRLLTAAEVCTLLL